MHSCENWSMQLTVMLKCQFYLVLYNMSVLGKTEWRIYGTLELLQLTVNAWLSQNKNLCYDEVQFITLSSELYF